MYGGGLILSGSIESLYRSAGLVSAGAVAAGAVAACRPTGSVVLCFAGTPPVDVFEEAFVGGGGCILDPYRVFEAVELVDVDAQRSCVAHFHLLSSHPAPKLTRVGRIHALPRR